MKALVVFTGRACTQRHLRLATVVVITFIHMTYVAVAKADGSYDFYAQHIQAYLGSEYVEQFRQLTRGDFRYEPHTAQYMIFAFAQGWHAGYFAGSWVPYNHTQGRPDQQQQLEIQALQGAQSQMNQWVGLRPEEQHVVVNFLNAGWRAGWERGRNDAVAGNVQPVTPQPSQGEFRKHYQPPGLLAAPQSEDIWGDLRNRP